MEIYKQTEEENENDSALNHPPCSEPCPIEKGMALIGGKWKGSILWHLMAKPMRFNEIARQFPGASRKIINQRLKELEEHGLLKRDVLCERPIAVSYSLTPFGVSTTQVLQELKKWAEDNKL